MILKRQFPCFLMQFPLLNLEIVANSNRWLSQYFNFLLNKLNFCCGNNLRKYGISYYYTSFYRICLQCNIGTKVKESRNFAAVIYLLHFFISWRKQFGRLAYGYGSKIRNNVSENEVGTLQQKNLFFYFTMESKK